MSTNVQELQTIDISLKKLLAWKENVRTAASEEGIAELAASIAAVGLLQSLVVKKAPRGKFSVVAGKRRLAALSRLVEAGTWPATVEIPCRVMPGEADLTEVSLAENVQREPMHPADEFAAFQRLIESGRCVADVAARFGVTEAVVNRRLALARVSPVLLEKYRAGEMNLELLQAFTLTEGHDVQEDIWNSLPTWNRRPDMVRQMLSHEAIPATDRRVRFVGLEHYEAEGGAVKRDLFSEGGEEGVYILDSAKLIRLASDKLAQIADTVKKDGWKWVDVQPEVDYGFIHKHRRIYAQAATLSPETQAELDALTEEYETLREQCEADEQEAGESEGDEPVYTRLGEIENRIEAIQESSTCDYPENVKAACGVVVTIGHNGSPELMYGLLRKEDETALIPSASADGSCAAPSGRTEREEKPRYSAALIEALTVQKTAAIAAELTQNPRVALAAVVHALALEEFHFDLHLYRATKGCLQISSSHPNLAEAKDSPALTALEQQRKDWLSLLPKQPGELWRWFLTQEEETLLRLLAFCAGAAVNAIQAKHDSEGRDRLPHADALAMALEIEMTRWFTPTAGNFFGRISKARIAEAMTEAGKTPDAGALAMKKAQLAKIAELDIAGTGWLPQPVRIHSKGPSPIGPTPAETAEDHAPIHEMQEGGAR